MRLASRRVGRQVCFQCVSMGAKAGGSETLGPDCTFPFVQAIRRGKEGGKKVEQEALAMLTYDLGSLAALAAEPLPVHCL